MEENIPINILESTHKKIFFEEEFDIEPEISPWSANYSSVLEDNKVEPVIYSSSEDVMPFEPADEDLTSEESE